MGYTKGKSWDRKSIHEKRICCKRMIEKIPP